MVVRMRPLSSKEAVDGSGWECDSSSIKRCSLTPEEEAKGAQDSFDFGRNNVFGPEASTSDLYQKTLDDVVDSFVEGKNVTVFAYGQTGSGKTHTMYGDKATEEKGVSQLAVEDMFKAVMRLTSTSSFFIRVSMCEIYNECVRDLLNPPSTNLVIREDKANKSVVVMGLSEHIVVSVEEVMEFMEKGNSERVFGATALNDASSRSHTIFRVILESTDANKAGTRNQKVKQSTLNLVDLAGSERSSQANTKGLQMKEGNHINKSLLVLGLCIKKLTQASSGRRIHIPFRDSKLTRILKPSLGGNAKTFVICTTTPSMRHCDQTLSTMRFACNAGQVKNKVSVNQVAFENACMGHHHQRIVELEQQSGAEVSDVKTLSRDEMESELARLKSLVISARSGTLDNPFASEPSRKRDRRRLSMMVTSGFQKKRDQRFSMGANAGALDMGELRPIIESDEARDSASPGTFRTIQVTQLQKTVNDLKKKLRSANESINTLTKEKGVWEDDRAKMLASLCSTRVELEAMQGAALTARTSEELDRIEDLLLLGLRNVQRERGRRSVDAHLARETMIRELQEAKEKHALERGLLLDRIDAMAAQQEEFNERRESLQGKYNNMVANEAKQKQHTIQLEMKLRKTFATKNQVQIEDNSKVARKKSLLPSRSHPLHPAALLK